MAAEAVASALAQTYTHLDVILVDDGSTDPETLRTLDALAEDDRTTLVRQENQGLSAARNAGIRASTADLILPLDADDLIDAVYVEEAVAILAKSPEVRLVYCRADLFGSETGPWSLQDFSWPVILVHNLIFASCVYRREDWEAVGGYDSSFVHGREDHDFILKLLGLAAETMNKSFGQSRKNLIDPSAPSSRVPRRTFEKQHGVGAAGAVVRPGGLWGAAVNSLARGAGEKRVRRFASFADRMLPITPSVIGEKLVALSVESAAIAGYDRDDPNRTLI